MNAKHSVLFGAAVVVAIGAWALSRSRDPWTGSVTDPDGRPIAGVLVTLLDTGPSEERVDPNAPSTKTDESGRFRLDLPAGDEPRLELLYEAAGFAPDVRNVTTKRPFDMKLEPATALSGRVLTEPGRVPIAGALVADVRYDGIEGRYASTTDADGRFRIDGIAANHPSEILVQAPGCVPLREEIPFGTDRSYERDFHVPSEPVVMGRVIDLETSEPIADALIVPLPMGGDTAYREIARSGTDGTFVFTGSVAACNGAGIEVRKDGYARSRRELDDPSWSEASSTAVTMGLLRECVLEGTVTDEAGAPVAGATIAATPGGLDAVAASPIRIPPGLTVAHYGAHVAHSGPDGRYRLTNLLPMITDAWVLMSTHELHASAVLPAFSAPGQTKQLDWTVPRDPSVVEGRVTVNGAPVSARVSWRCGSFSGGLERGEAYTTKKGAFRTEPIPPGEAKLRVALGDGFEPHIIRVDVAPATPMRHDIDLTIDLARIEGALIPRKLVRVPGKGISSKDLVPDSNRSDCVNRRVIATRERDGARIEAMTNDACAFTFTLPDATWDEWKVALADEPDDPITTHSGATAVRLVVLRMSDD